MNPLAEVGRVTRHDNGDFLSFFSKEMDFLSEEAPESVLLKMHWSVQEVLP